ncbi:reverse transcriptase domain-containing protein [Nephila pilipes]|uniref:Reverse transcriptase domain-containing protein n=1 Tax=Nephila pilipes TaxID=299642 RepID=A0A8X6KKI2_NEPPI|nr:reverse transcriptase domain-containing protein [Nephila pilipes]GFS55763.1 reverse transcriptase domain-containing protein [Nephila pilipes]
MQCGISNWRPVSLLNTGGKVFSSVFVTRISSWANINSRLSPFQKGFRENDGCAEHNFLLDQAISDAKRSHQNLSMAWLYLENAFGSVPHQFILTALEHAGVPSGTISIISALYTGSTRTICTSAGWTGPIAMKAGVRQGCPLSAILFNLSLEQILRTGVSAPGYHLFGQEFKCLAYADDLLLLSNSSSSLQQNILLLLASDDLVTSSVAFASLQSAVRKKILRDPTLGECADFLNGKKVDEFARESGDLLTQWSRARHSADRLSKFLKFNWTWNEELSCFYINLYRFPNPVCVAPSTAGLVTRFLRDDLESFYIKQLSGLVDQGKTVEVFSQHPESNHFLQAGDYTRFCDWNFIHRARLGCLQLNATMRFSNRNPRCLDLKGRQVLSSLP